MRTSADSKTKNCERIVNNNNIYNENNKNE